MLYKKLIRDYLNFSRQDRIGVMSLLVLILVIYFLPLLFSKDKETFPLEEDPLLSLAIDSLTKAEKEQQTELPAGAYRPASPGRTNGFVRKELFAFDPNTLPAEGWRRLGLPDRVIGTL